MPGLLGSARAVLGVMKPLRSAERRYLPGAIPVMENWPEASVEAVLLTWMLVTPGETSMRRKETRARRTGSPVAAFEPADGTQIVGFGLGRERERQQ